MSFTVADFNGWLFKHDDVHFNGGKEFFGWGHRCVDQPRLLIIDKHFRRDRSTQRSYLIDGRTPCTTLDEALAALSVPPAVGADDIALLRTLPPDGWSRPEQRAPYIPVAEMGLIEWGRDEEKRVTCRLTEAGRNILASETAQ